MRIVQRLHIHFILVLLLSLVIFSSCSTGTPQTAGNPSGTSTAVPEPTVVPESLDELLQTEQSLLATPRPLLDPYSLAQRFKSLNVSSGGARTTPLNARVGQEDSFWLQDSITHSFRHIHARLLLVTPHAYMYVEDGQAVNQAALQASADLFETSLYPDEHKVFGEEWSPGIDGDVHLTILNATGLGEGVGGYFAARDEYPSSVNSYSNMREMLYLNLDNLTPGSADYNGALASELQHLIHWHKHPADPAWFDNGMAVVAQYLNGFPTNSTLFLQTPDTQLTDWSNDVEAAGPHYGAAFLFLDYFAEHYGGYHVLKELLNDPAPPPLNFDHVLAKHGYNEHFIDVLHNWYIANCTNDPQNVQEPYSYPDLQVPALTPQHKFSSFPATANETVHQYAAAYYDILPSTRHHGTLTITLNGAPSVPLVENASYQGHNQWWSNRGSNLDSTLTHNFDLSHLRGKHVALQFAIWFDLARKQGYAFVEASLDGQHWTALKAQHTSEEDFGLGRVNAYIGTSGGGAAPEWLQESVDLSPYAGHRVQVRFETLSGGQPGATSMQGFVLGHVSIPALHFEDAFGNDDGWSSNGFYRSTNVVPEHYTMQALLYQHQQFTVFAQDIDLASGRGTLSIPGFGPTITRVVLIVSAYAAETTAVAHYRIDASLS